MTEQALKKIEDGLKSLKGDRYVEAMKHYVADALMNFVRQNEEFARAVAQGGSFQDCMAAVKKKITGGSISDLDACRAAAEFYFPGSVVAFQMTIRTSRYEEASGEGIALRLEDFL